MKYKKQHQFFLIILSIILISANLSAQDNLQYDSEMNEYEQVNPYNRLPIFAGFNFYGGYSGYRMDLSLGGQFTFLVSNLRNSFNFGISLDFNFEHTRYMRNYNDYTTSHFGNYLDISVHLLFKFGVFNSIIFNVGVGANIKAGGTTHRDFPDLYTCASVELGYLYLSKDFSYGLYFAFYSKLYVASLKHAIEFKLGHVSMGLKFSILLNLD